MKQVVSAIVRSMRRGVSGYRLRWKAADGAWQDYWTPELAEAVAVKNALQAGRMLDEALQAYARAS